MAQFFSPRGTKFFELTRCLLLSIIESCQVYSEHKIYYKHHIQYWNHRHYYPLYTDFTSWSDIRNRTTRSPPVSLQRSASGQRIYQTRHTCRCCSPWEILPLPLEIKYPCECSHWTRHPYNFPPLGYPCPWIIKGSFIPDQTACCSSSSEIRSSSKHS